MSALKLSGVEIRQAFLDFYRQRGHQPLPSGSLVPEDPTMLLTVAITFDIKKSEISNNIGGWISFPNID